MSKILIITNHSYMLYRFRLELIQELMKEHEVVLSMPFVGHEEDFQALGLRCIKTDVGRISGTIFLCAAPPDSDRFETLGDQQMKVYLERFAVPEMFLKVGSDLFVLPYL